MAYAILSNVISSSSVRRHLEKESHRNVELMWLLERLQPDFKTTFDSEVQEREF